MLNKEKHQQLIVNKKKTGYVTVKKGLVVNIMQ